MEPSPDEPPHEQKPRRLTKRIVTACVLLLLAIPFGLRFHAESTSVTTQRTAGKFLLIGDVARARQEVEWLHFLSPNHPVPLYVLGMCEEMENNGPAALAYYERSILGLHEQDELHRELSLRLGISLFEERLFDRAEVTLTDFVERHPDSDQPGVILKAIYLSQLRVEEARQILAPRISETDANLPMLLELLSVENPPNPNEISGYLEETLKKHPEQPSVILALGVANWQHGDIDGARRQLERALEYRPKDQRFRIVVADFYLDEGLLKKAQSLLDGQSFDDPNHGYWAVRSRLAERNGKYREAVTDIDRALATHRNIRRYVYSKARLMQRLGKADEAETLHAEAARRSKASQELLAAAIRLSTEQPSAEDCRQLARQYELTGNPQIASAWRSIVARMKHEPETSLE